MTDSTLFALLAIRQHKLNQVLGIRRITPQVGLLISCYIQARQKEIESLPIHTWAYQALKSATSQAQALIAAAESTPPENKTALLQRVEELNGYAAQLTHLLEEIAHAYE